MGDSTVEAPFGRYNHVASWVPWWLWLEGSYWTKGVLLMEGHLANQLAYVIISPWKPRYPLKMDGWKMTFRFKDGPFSGNILIFRGVHIHIYIYYYLYVYLFIYLNKYIYMYIYISIYFETLAKIGGLNHILELQGWRYLEPITKHGSKAVRSWNGTLISSRSSRVSPPQATAKSPEQFCSSFMALMGRFFCPSLGNQCIYIGLVFLCSVIVHFILVPRSL